MTALLVAVGAAFGAALRLLVARALPGLRATLVVNVVGSGVLGALFGSSRSTYALLGIGFCGALTTFSSFAVEAVESRSPRYVVLTIVLCLAAAALGLAW